MTLEELFKRYPWRSKSRFIPLAKKHGFTEQDAKEFLKTKAPRDKRKIKKIKYLPIINRFGDTKPSYQFDTLIQAKLEPYLIFININTRKAYAYKMKNKNKSSVLDALKEFLKDVPDCAILTSDRDKAYLSDDVLNFISSKGIEYHTTHNNNHNILGIINRFIRTLRDLNNERDFTEERIQELIKEYNNSPHRGIGDLSPNEVDTENETKYIKEKLKDSSNTNNFIEGDRVRIIQDKSPLTKHRTNLSKEAYIVDGRDRNQIIIRSKDGSIDTYPAYRLIKSDNRYKLADTIRNQQRGIVDKILNYNEKKDKYNILYDEGTKDTIPSKNMRESEPTKLSPMELSYWSKQPSLPNSIKKWL